MVLGPQHARDAGPDDNSSPARSPTPRKFNVSNVDIVSEFFHDLISPDGREAEMRAKRNPIARDLRTPKYKPRVVRPKKGAGAYV